MHIAITGLVDLEPLAAENADAPTFPRTRSFPMVGQLAAEYLKRGHKVSVVAMHEKPGSAAKFQYSSGPLSVTVLYRRPSRTVALDRFRREIRDFSAAIRDTKADVVHAHWTNEFGLAGLRSGLPCVVSAHDVPGRVLRHMPHKWYWFSVYLVARRVGREAKVLTANSAYTLDAWQRMASPSCKVVLVPNALRSDLPPERTQQGPPQRIGSVGNGFSPLKNTATLIRAFSKVKQARKELTLTLYGDEHEPGGKAAAWARRNGFEDGITFAGLVPHADLLARLREEVDLLVHPSLEESFGMVVLEAQALGIPVIGGKNSGAIPWLLDYGLAGDLCDVSSSDSLASAIVQATKKPRPLTVAYAAYRAREMFAMPTCADKYLDVLASLTE